MKKTIVIIGGVAGGANAAARARRLSEDSEIIVLERGEYVSFANCGLPYHIGGEIEERKKLLVHTPETLRDRFNLDVRIRSEVVAIDPAKQVVVVRNHATKEEYNLAYHELVIATGAAPVRPPIPGLSLPGIFTLRDMNDMDGIIAWSKTHAVKEVVIVGGGFIGLEMLEQLATHKIKLTLVEASKQLLAPLDLEMAAYIHREVQQHGVTLNLADPVAEFVGSDRVTGVRTRAGKSFPAQMVIFSIGVRPETTLAAAAGMKLGKSGGIWVDQHLRTSEPHIWAVGDCIETPNAITGVPGVVPLAGPANRQGRIVADNIFGIDSRYRQTQGTAIVRVFGLTAAVTGANETTLKANGVPFEAVHLHPRNHAGYYPGATGIALKLLFSPTTGKVLGAQAVGRDGVDKRIDVIATAIHGSMTVDDLAELELCYAPPFGSAKDPVNLAGMIAQNVRGELVRTGHPVTALTDYPDALILDVRDPGEYAKGALPNAVHIPLNELRSRIGELPEHREILVYCQSGQRSYNACRILTQRGYRCVNLSGAYNSWEPLKHD